MPNSFMYFSKSRRHPGSITAARVTRSCVLPQEHFPLYFEKKCTIFSFLSYKMPSILARHGCFMRLLPVFPKPLHDIVFSSSEIIMKDQIFLVKFLVDSDIFLDRMINRAARTSHGMRRFLDRIIASGL